MLNILIVANHQTADLDWVQHLKKDHVIHQVNQTCEATTLNHVINFDLFISVSKTQIDKSTWDLIDEVYSGRSRMTPFIFITEQRNEKRTPHESNRTSWFFLTSPIKMDELNFVMDEALTLIESTNIQTFQVEDKTYQVRDVACIKRYEKRYLILYSHDPDDPTIENEDMYPYRAPFKRFFEERMIEEYFVQVRENWFVNRAYIKEIRHGDREVLLKNGMVIPASKEHLKKLKKEG